jgi:glyoxylase-like metal-dependent hydrolase (beta-lactamase superfamily II)
MAVIRHAFPKKKSLVFLCAVLVLISTLPEVSHSHKQDSDHGNGKRIIENALNALGGLEAIDRVKTLEIHYTSANNMIGQNDDPYHPSEGYVLNATLIFDRTRDYLVNDYHILESGSQFRQRVLKKGNQVVFLDMMANKAVPFSASATLTYYRRIVPFWLLNLYMADSAYSFAGETNLNGRDCYVLDVNESGGTKLFIDKATARPIKIQTRTDDPVYGLQTIEMTFESYRLIDGGISIPNEISVHNNGSKQASYFHMEAFVNSKFDESLFELPAGVTYDPDPKPPKLEEVAPNIFFIQDQEPGYNTTFVNFKEFIVVLDSPLGTEYSQLTQKFITEKFPGKPVRWVLLSHYHTDHIGGLAQFVSSGAGIILSEGLQKFVSDFLQTPHSMIPDPMKGKNIQLQYQLVKNKWVLKDEDITMEVLQVGPNAHVQDMLMAYFPKQRILWQADMLIVARESGQLPPGFLLEEEFDRLLTDLKLDGTKVEKVLPVHGRPATLGDLREIAGKRKLVR